MKPIQLWLPYLQTRSWFDAPFKRDIERAMKSWKGEERIWLLPSCKEKTCWVREETNIVECAIPSETFNLITVVHISEEGYMYPPGGNCIPTEWEGQIPNDLLEQWLNAEYPFFIKAKKEYKINMPIIKNKKVVFAEMSLPLSPGSSIPISSVDEEKGKISFQWPPENSMLVDSISPESESRELLGNYMWQHNSQERSSIFNTVENAEGRKALHCALLWPEPFRQMFPFGGGWDLLTQKTIMKDYIKNSDSKQLIIQQDTAIQASKYSFEGWTVLEKQTVMPTWIVKGQEELLFKVEARYNIEVNNVKELMEHAYYKEKFLSKIPITRIFGWEGYLWWELNNRMKNSKKSLKICERCGNIISGNKNRKYCRKLDNPSCSREGDKNRKRKERNKD
ncbi:hypothetical protein [Priestia aryabhattai]|uniref:hypothetical protein n=1 Tax=Priestia aryabhattai TaxID=412384 RepID=UPI0027E47D85|nr:hypothetical protein [Priestia aryabhattai]WJW97219.1 hypothetical protein P0182_14290 [Priestia aryabhattai]